MGEEREDRELVAVSKFFKALLNRGGLIPHGELYVPFALKCLLKQNLKALSPKHEGRASFSPNVFVILGGVGEALWDDEAFYEEVSLEPWEVDDSAVEEKLGKVFFNGGARWSRWCAKVDKEKPFLLHARILQEVADFLPGVIAAAFLQHLLNLHLFSEPLRSLRVKKSASPSKPSPHV